jgi:predicted nucleic-acid-binding protein
MIGVDTNVLIRHILQDDPLQSPKATELIEDRLTERNPGFLSTVVLVETAWVLERVYDRSPHEIAFVIERLLQIKSLVVERRREVFNAMLALQEGRGSFADALIGELAIAAGCFRTLTFDRKAARLPGFQLL